jgi:biotin carboxyl carrier protein
MRITPLGAGIFRIDDRGTSRLAFAAGPADSRWVFLDGYTYVVDTSPGSRRGARRRGTAQDDALAAPMPATVVAVNVEPGQRVLRGDVMIVLEAMKMELPIRASRDAVVRAVACRPGELVQPGVPLLELE